MAYVEALIGVGATFIKIIISLIIFAGIGGVLFLVVYRRKFNGDCTIKEISGGSMLIHYDKFRILHEKNGGKWLQLLKRKKKLPVPSEKAKAIRRNGRLHIELYYTDEGEYLYCSQDPADIGKKISLAPPVPFKDIILDKDTTRREKALRTTEGMRPISSTERQLMVMEIEASKKWNVTSWLKENAGLIVSGVTLIITFLMFYLILELVVPGAIQLGASMDHASTELNNMAQVLANSTISIGGVPY